MKIIDCFTFYNELTMLKFRLEYLYETVDHFVIVEATLTHSGNPKPLFFETNKHMFSKYLDKIVHVVVNDMPRSNFHVLSKSLDYTMRREYHQRQCIDRGIKSLSLSDKDLILISDCDEIPNRDTIKNTPIEKMYSLKQDMYYYNLTMRDTKKWFQAKICPYSTYLLFTDPQTIRAIQTEVLENGGWHFSYFGSVDFMLNKIRNFCHSDMFRHLSDDILRDKIKEGTLLSGMPFIEIQKVGLNEDNSLPEGYEILLTLSLGE